MGNIQSSLSKTKKKVKQRLPGRKRKPDGTGSDPGEGRADSTSSLPRPEPHVVAGESRNREQDGADAAGEPVSSKDPPPHPDGPGSVPARGDDNSQEGGEADVDGGETSQRESHPHLDAEIVVGSGRSEELEGVHPSPSTPSIPRGGTPDSTWTRSSQLSPLIVPSDNVDSSTLPDRGPEVTHSDESLEPSAAADEKESNSKSTTSATAELRGVRDSAHGFGPLKSVATSLCSILDNCEVWPLSHTFYSPRSRLF